MLDLQESVSGFTCGSVLPCPHNLIFISCISAQVITISSGGNGCSGFQSGLGETGNNTIARG